MKIFYIALCLALCAKVNYIGADQFQLKERMYWYPSDVKAKDLCDCLYKINSNDYAGVVSITEFDGNDSKWNSKGFVILRITDKEFQKYRNHAFKLEFEKKSDLLRYPSLIKAQTALQDQECGGEQVSL